MRKLLTGIIAILAFVMAVFHLYSGGIQLFPATQQRAVHLGLAFALVFLLHPFIKKKKVLEKPKSKFGLSVNIILSILSLVVGGYLTVRYLDLPMEISSPSSITIIIGVLVILLTLEVARRMLGLALPIIAVIFLIYAFIGDKLPLMIQHSGYSFEQIVTQIGLSNQGVFGIPLGVSASYIVLFVVFGAMLEKSGAGNMFLDLAMGLVGRFRGGAAKVSVVASALFGSISGSQVANVVTTGVLTIPLMKRAGYKPTYAAAVESVASTGGMILPPIMGAVAFLMADFLQVSYAEVAFAALIPAIIYFVAIFVMVDLRAAKEGLQATEVENNVDLKELILKKGHLMLPLIVLVILLMVFQMTANNAAFWAIVSVPLACLLRKETRMPFRQIIIALQEGVKLSLMVVAACSAAGIVIGVIDMTGMGLRFSSVLLELSGGNLLLLCILTMLASIIMGMGLPPVASYLVLAILAAPAMVNLGVPPIAAHLFIFYYGTLSAITPPVALASYAAAGLSDTSPMRVSLVACRLALVAFIVPYMFVFGPELLLIGSAIPIIFATITALIGVYAIAVSIEGYFKAELGIYSRLILFAGSIMLITVNVLSSFIGLSIILIVLMYEWRSANKINETIILDKSL
ncbi:C4-dicarboxylate ABC transporter permease [Sporosarcina sp. P16b]|uniref:TRAP transporter permease n=1 Tax=Sporosarcina sp. P16b TaxID=2048261 RepID=UPI000C16BFF5|nr:TRAP transporter permease [Sporosarcina sp. P16b]PIC70295.1 C4-dicarboxylate ABC transporter permease [Sporosarcina sp. P16b]